MLTFQFNAYVRAFSQGLERGRIAVITLWYIKYENSAINQEICGLFLMSGGSRQ